MEVRKFHLEVPCYKQNIRHDTFCIHLVLIVRNTCLNMGKKIHIKIWAQHQETKLSIKVKTTNGNLPAKGAQHSCPISALKSLGTFCWQYSANDLFKSLSFFKAENAIHIQHLIF